MKKYILAGIIGSALLLSACSSEKQTTPYTAKPFSETVYNMPNIKYNRVLNFGDFQVVEYQDLKSNTVDPTQTIVVVPVLDRHNKGAVVAYTFDKELARRYITDPKRYVLTSSKAFDQKTRDENPASYVVGMEDVRYATMQVVGNPSYMNNKLFADNRDTIAQEIQNRLNTLYPGTFHVAYVKIIR